MDPVTAIAAATAAYNAIKKGFAVGKEIESMAGDLGRWMNAIGHVKQQHNKAKGRRFGSVEEEALETFAAKKQAEQMEHELRNYITMTYGMNAWQEILRIQGEIRKKEQQEKIRRERERDELLYNLFIGGCVVLFLCLIVPIIWLFIQNA